MFFEMTKNAEGCQKTFQCRGIVCVADKVVSYRWGERTVAPSAGEREKSMGEKAVRKKKKKCVVAVGRGRTSPKNKSKGKKRDGDTKRKGFSVGDGSKRPLFRRSDARPKKNE